VLKGSLERRETTSSLHDMVEPKREELIGSGVFVRSKDGYRLERDMAFSSPSLRNVFPRV
jgi:hypothetical protein